MVSFKARSTILALLTILFVFLFAIPSFAAFKDVSDSSLSYKISALQEKNIINGFPDGTFRPQDPVTRAQMAKMIVLAKGYNLDTAQSASINSTFKDVPNNHWAAVYIKAISDAGIAKGYPDGTFQPNRKITRAELARMLRRAIEVKQVTAIKASYSDVPKTYWAFNEIETVSRYQLMGGYKDGTFRPAEPATRSQIANAVYKMINNTYPKESSIDDQQQNQPQSTDDTSTISKPSSKDGKIIVCIDAGHGGNDPGAIAKSNALTEKEVNLAVALKLKALLEQEQINGTKIEIVMTRSTDIFVDLGRRAQIANLASADIFVSIHHNSFSTETAAGTSVYSYPGSKSGAELAAIIQKELVREFGWEGVSGKDDGIHTANYKVLRDTLMTAVLCESAYMSNPEEAALLATDEFRQKEAYAIFKGVVKYLDAHSEEF